MAVSDETVDVARGRAGSETVLWSRRTRVLGNGVVDDIRDVVYVKPETFERTPHAGDRRRDRTRSTARLADEAHGRTC